MKILQINSDGETVAKWESPSEAAKHGYDDSHISKCLKGKRTTHLGFTWKWSGEEKEKEETHSEKSIESKSFDYHKDKAVLAGKTRKSITSLQEALDFFEVDTSVWEAERFTVNSWDNTNALGETSTNYQVKVYLKKREVTIDEIIVRANEVLKNYSPRPIPVRKGRGTITAEISDLHIGADIKDLVRTPDFNVKILADYLKSVSEVINSYNSERVVINIHGDIFESISGLNHPDSWKSLGVGMYGSNVIIYASELINGAFLSNIENLDEVNLIPGNHDRLSPSKAVDFVGEGAGLIAYLIKKDFPNLTVNYNPLILVREIDNIIHIMTHGHHGISKRDVSKVVADYGDSKKFNLWTEGHFHSRVVKKTLKQSIGSYHDVDVVTLDELKYRKLRLSPLFTGNFFQESMGFGGHAGCMITYNNGRGIPIIHDYTI